MGKKMVKKIPKKTLLLIPAIAVLAVSAVAWKFRRELTLSVFERIAGGRIKVDGNGQNLSLQGTQGDYSFDQGKVPENFPKDFPVYTKAKFIGSWTAKGENGYGISVIWQTESSVAEAKNFYMNEFPKAGWQITNTFDADNSSTISFSKDTKSGFLGITRADNLTTISVTVGIK